MGQGGPGKWAVVSDAGADGGRAIEQISTERTDYRFDVLADYGAFRDLQRHRMLTIEWQPLTPNHGYEMPDAIVDAGLPAVSAFAVSGGSLTELVQSPSALPAGATPFGIVVTSSDQENNQD